MITLVQIEDRVSTLLADMTRLNFPVSLIDEGIRLALMEYSRASGVTETLSGLDGATASTLPDLDSGILVLGAAGYAATAKSIDRIEAFNLDGQVAQQVQQLGGRFLDRFADMLLTVRCGRMRAGTVQPWGSGWPLSI